MAARVDTEILDHPVAKKLVGPTYDCLYHFWEGEEKTMALSAKYHRLNDLINKEPHSCLSTTLYLQQHDVSDVQYIYRFN